MIYREAVLADIDKYMKVRMAVKENVLNNPALVTREDNEHYLTTGKGWVCEIDGEIVGFAIVGLQEKNIWALFVDPRYEQIGIGKKLHYLMMQWYFEQTSEPVWLSTSPSTRAETFYRKNGWKHVGMYGNELKFEMHKNDWVAVSS